MRLIASIALTLLFTLNLAACASSHITHDARSDTEAALPLILEAWSAELDFDLASAPLPPIYWWDVDCLNHSSVPHDYEGPDCLAGQYNGTDQGRIDLTTPVSQRISNSSLSHELLHWAMDMAETRTDPLHKDVLWHEVDGIDSMLWQEDL